MSDKSIPLRPNATETPTVHRQASIRYAPNVHCGCRIVALSRDPLRPAKVLDLSATGVSLLLNHRYEAETLLAVELTNSDESLTRLMLVRVVHTQELSPGNHIVGGAFTTKLPGEELQELLS